MAFVAVLGPLAPSLFTPLADLAHGLHHIVEDEGLAFLLDPHFHRDGGPAGDADHTGHTPAVDALLSAAAAGSADEMAPATTIVTTVDLHLPASSEGRVVVRDAPAPGSSGGPAEPENPIPTLEPPPPRPA